MGRGGARRRAGAYPLSRSGYAYSPAPQLPASPLPAPVRTSPLPAAFFTPWGEG